MCFAARTRRRFMRKNTAIKTLQRAEAKKEVRDLEPAVHTQYENTRTQTDSPSVDGRIPGKVPITLKRPLQLHCLAFKEQVFVDDILLRFTERGNGLLPVLFA